MVRSTRAQRLVRSTRAQRLVHSTRAQRLVRSTWLGLRPRAKHLCASHQGSHTLQQDLNLQTVKAAQAVAGALHWCAAPGGIQNINMAVKQR